MKLKQIYYSQHIKKGCKWSEGQTDKESVPAATDFRKTKASEYNCSKLMINHEGTKLMTPYFMQQEWNLPVSSGVITSFNLLLLIFIRV